MSLAKIIYQTISLFVLFFSSERKRAPCPWREDLVPAHPGMRNLSSPSRCDAKAESTSSTSPAIPVITEIPELSNMECRVWLIPPQIKVVTPTLLSMETRSDEERFWRDSSLLCAPGLSPAPITRAWRQESKTGATRDRNIGMATTAT